ncbi:hypothetical protein C1H46_015591 [Malus baccata]|uniref:Sulfhydryl oxidase n=1 Tax=Malus baccata TaxID=106549 RepID=A0A540MJ03_MALBA|nr:hypothetical protein C1H46_015591 [Malus baccata]
MAEASPIARYVTSCASVKKLLLFQAQAKADHEEASKLIPHDKTVYINHSRKLGALISLKSVRLGWKPKRVVIFHADQKICKKHRNITMRAYKCPIIISEERCRFSDKKSRIFNKFARKWHKLKQLKKKVRRAYKRSQDLLLKLVHGCIGISQPPIVVHSAAEFSEVVSLKQGLGWRVRLAEDIKQQAEEGNNNVLEIAASAGIQVLDVPEDILDGKGKSSTELEKSTWTFLQTIAAQYPDTPTVQQKDDVKELMSVLSRMFPCNEHADFFEEILRSNPVQTGSQAEFSRWLCHVHEIAETRLNKPVSPESDMMQGGAS